jgi:hypothetical protein
MNITPEQLLAEAGQMALELRLKDRAIAVLEARITELEQRAVEEPTPEP